jgi:hypothetical protein
MISHVATMISHGNELSHYIIDDYDRQVFYLELGLHNSLFLTKEQFASTLFTDK